MSVFLRDPNPEEPSRFKAQPVNAFRPLTAAAVRVKIGDQREKDQMRARRTVSAWQQEAFYQFDAIGELQYAFSLVGAVLSRMILFVAAETKPSEPPTALEDYQGFNLDLAEAAQSHFNRLRSSHGGIPGLLRDCAINLSVVGECFLVQELADEENDIPERWSIRSIDEIVVDTSGNVSLRLSRAGAIQNTVPIDPKAFVGRIWVPHPRWSDEALSSMKAVLELGWELLLLSKSARATAKSRLNAGALFIPDGLSVAAAPEAVTEGGDPEVDHEDDVFENELIAAMTLPIQDEDAASAVVPLIIRGPGELGSQIKQFKFERSFDPALVERADRVLERILQGIDLPKDIVTGLANVRYNNALRIEESLFRAHIEPLTLMICDALTTIFMRPALIAAGYDEAEVEKVYIWYDPSAILSSVNRASDASEGWDRYLLSGSSWRSAHGFSDADAPTGEELLKRITVSRGQISGELVEAVLQQVAPETMKAVREGNLAAGGGEGMPESVQQLLSGEAPSGMEGEPLPDEILQGLPIGSGGSSPAAPPAATPPPTTPPPAAPVAPVGEVPIDEFPVLASATSRSVRGRNGKR